MSSITKIEDSKFDLEYARGDDFPSKFSLTGKKTKSPVDISGYSFVMTVNKELNPTDTANQLFAVVGVITDAINGKVSFSPTSTDTNQPANSYFYDISMVDSSGSTRTIIKAKFTITQDISK